MAIAGLERDCRVGRYDWRIMPSPAKPVAHSFVLEELQSALSPNRLRVRPMFGSHALYVDEKIVLILRRKQDQKSIRDDGVWVALANPDLGPSMKKAFPTLREIEMFKERSRTGFSGWLNLPEGEDGFEEAALEICRLVAKGDPRIGKVPKPKAKAGTKKRSPSR
jgi:hypothetical protein